MSHPHEVSDLERRKLVRLRLRPGLVITPQRSGQRVCYVIKDPVNLRFFHLEENQRFLAQLMDGRHTLADIQKTYEEKRRPERVSLEELEAFAAQLLESGLIQNESRLAGKMLYGRAVRQRRQTLWLTLLNFLNYRVPLWNPDRFLTSLTAVGRLLFNPYSLVLSLFVFVVALGLGLSRRESLLLDLPTVNDFFSWKNLVLFWCLLGMVKILHELGHGLCCKAMGAKVQGMGVMFLIFFPTLYCNVSDSWTLASKWKRIAISAAGIYVELWIASLSCFLWNLTDSGTLIHHVSLGVILVCTVNTLLCNGNPLMRFDGYYVLADWLEVPNLAQQSSRFLRTFLLRGLGFHVSWEDPQGRAARGFLIGFGLASCVYRWTMLIVALYLVHCFFQAHQLGSVGFLVVALGLGSVLGSLVYGFARSIKRGRRFPEMQRARFYLAVTLALSLVLAFFFLPLPCKVQGVALIQVEPESCGRVSVAEPGFLQEVLVQDGQRVKVGEVLAVLTSPQLEAKLKINEADQSLRDQQQRTFVALLSDLELQDQPEWDTWMQNNFEQKALLQSHRTLKKQMDGLVLRAPRHGIVQGLQSQENKGKWLEKGTEVCKVANERALRALVLVDPTDQKLIHHDSPARILVHGSGSHSFKGTVTGIAQADAKNVPPQLSNRVGGNVATQQDPVTKAEKPHSPHYLVAVRFQEGDSQLHPGVLGSVKIETESQTLSWRVRRFLGSTFNWGL
jgi:putative peptide zinc metalloprotease protein